MSFREGTNIMRQIDSAPCVTQSSRARAAVLRATLMGAMFWSGSTAAVDCIGPDIVTPAVCGVNVRPPVLSCTVPTDAEPFIPNFLFQRSTNVFSWQAFIGLQWPASATERGVPNVKANIGDPGPRVWETWREANEVFRSDADGKPVPPFPWSDPTHVPAACAGADRVLVRTTKVDDVLEDFTQPTGRNIVWPLTLKSQSLQLTRYEIRMNYTAYKTIVDNKWWDANQQSKLDSVVFPPGSMIVKAAWVPVGAGDETRFRTTNACVCDGPRCAVRKMGLVGWHLMSKTPSAPQWFWTTFEQNDNVGGACVTPLRTGTPVMAPAEPRPAPTYWSNAIGYQNINQQTPPGIANQICRVYPVSDSNPNCSNNDDATDNVRALNASVQAALRNTAFAHYQLINTQWPIPGSTPAGGPSTQFDVLPPMLGNTTMESFIQESSSCMGCHAMARTRRNVAVPDVMKAPAAFYSSDFTFMLGTAKPKLAAAPMLKVDPAKECLGVESDRCRGYRIAIDTYKQLSNNVGSKLHCGSCHLDAGRNPRAAWWGPAMWALYNPSPPPKPPLPQTSLAARINDCFTNSLHGTPLCVPDKVTGECPSSQPMKDLIAYMRWLSLPENAPEGTSVIRGYPPVGPGTGVRARGAKIFMQKCAFCHGADGQGRYDDDIYFRPALWGDRSYTKAAGMDTYTDLAKFIHANMPLGSGGEITGQEARDVACFIDQKPRPQGPVSKSASGKESINCIDHVLPPAKRATKR